MDCLKSREMEGEGSKSKLEFCGGHESGEGGGEGVREGGGEVWREPWWSGS